jgi:hypothetical protein
MKWTEEFVKNALKTTGDMDLGTLQPYGWLEFEPLFAKEYVKKLEILMKKAKDKKISIKELSRLWSTTAGLRCQLFFMLAILKADRIKKERRMNLVNFFFSMLDKRAVRDVHGTVSNITKTKKEVENLLKKIKPQKAEPETAKLLGKISNAAYNLIAGLYMDIYLDYAMENEGPYDVSKIYGPKHILVIKKYVGLKSDVWPEVKIPVNDLLMYCIYKDMKFSCDMASCHSIYEGDVINNLIAYRVVIEGKNLKNKEEVTKLLDPLMRVCVEQWKHLKSLPKEEQKKKGLFIKFYGMRKLFKKVGMDWQPNKEMLRSIKRPLKDNKFWNIPKENKSKFWKKIYNPEIDFYPGDTL